MSNPMQVFCDVCGLPLTDPESIARRMGPECAMRASEQFAAITNLTEALSTPGYVDDVARKFLIEKRIVESRLKTAKEQGDVFRIVRFTKALKRLNGILASRELARQQRALRLVQAA